MPRTRTVFFGLPILTIVFSMDCTNSGDNPAIANPNPENNLPPQDNPNPPSTGADNSNANPDSGSNNPPAENPNPPTIVLSLEEVAKHSTASDCWRIINDTVYDLSSFSNHPGGTTFVPFCGSDATNAFSTKGKKNQPHSENAVGMMPQFEVGSLNETIPLPAP